MKPRLQSGSRTHSGLQPETSKLGTEQSGAGTEQTCDGVRVGDEAWLTSTDGVTGPRQSTVSSGTTGRGVTGLRDLF